MLERLAVDVAVMAVLGLGAYKARALDKKGSLAAALIGLAVVELGGLYPFLAMLTFVVLGVVATKYRFSEKIKLGVAQGGNGIRSWGNVLGNGLPAVIFLALEYVAHRDVFWAASFAAIATANGDTLASELGKVFGRKPRLITNLRPARAGTNGAVSLAGEFFALLGVFIIALFSLPLTSHDVLMLVSVVVGGWVGVNIDSLIGATLENRGITDNNSTNFLASLFGGLIGAVVFYILT